MRLALLACLALAAASASAQPLVGLTNCCPNEVVRVDPATGTTTVVAAIGTQADAFAATVGSVALDAAGRRGFAVRNGRVIAIGLDTGAVTDVGPARGLSQLAGVDAVRGRLVAFTTEADPSVPPPALRIVNHVVLVDPATGDTTRVARVGVYDGPGGDTFGTVTGPAVASATHLYTVRNGRLLSVDLATGATLENDAPLAFPEVVGVDGPRGELVRIARSVARDVGPDSLDVYTARLVRHALAGGAIGPPDTLAVFATASVDPRTGATAGDTYLASFGVAFYDAGADRVLLRRNGALVGVDLATGAQTPLGAPGRVRYVPGPAGGAVAAAPGAAASGLALAVGPNPAAGAVGVRLTLAAAGPATVTVVDARGRRVALLHDGPLAPGTHAFTWARRGAAAGLYVVRAQTADGAAAARVALTR